MAASSSAADCVPAPSRWQIAYHRYREIQAGLADDPLGRMTAYLLRAAPQGRHVLNNRLARYEATKQSSDGAHLPEIPGDLLPELHRFADLRFSYRSDSAEFVFEDVYHVAFHHLASWRQHGQVVPSAKDCVRLYRGQRVDAWEVGPKIYRGLPNGGSRLKELNQRAAAACRVGQSIADKLDLSFEDGMAIAQHYSGANELGIPTWMMDFTRDPWVSLFFASHGGLDGECGIVWDIMPTEYERHSTGETNPIGQLQLVVPAGVPRIENQTGVFIVATHPEIFAQYVPFGWETRFRQITGLIFEDPVLGITRETIYPKEDPYLEMFAELRAASGAASGEMTLSCHIPKSLFADPSDPQIYHALLSCWLTARASDQPESSEPPGVRQLLPRLASYHALLHSERYAKQLPSVASRSINRLESAFENLFFARVRRGKPDLYEAVLSAYASHASISGDRRESNVLSEAMRESGIHWDVERFNG